MASRRTKSYFRILWTLIVLTTFAFAVAAEHHGQVTFNGLPVPGATVTVTQGDQKFVTITDDQGQYSFPNLPNGSWDIEITMSGFAPIKGQIGVGPNLPPAPPWELKMLPMDAMNAQTEAPVSGAPTEPAQPANAPGQPAANAVQPAANSAQPKAAASNKNAQPAAQAQQQQQEQQQEEDQRAADGLLINGSNNNGASSPFAQMAAFGNNRNGGRGLYNGGFVVQENNSALDANAFSPSGTVTPKPQTNQLTLGGTFGGPVKIPHITHNNGPTFNVQYQWTRNGTDTTDTGRVPTVDEREGNLSGLTTSTGAPVQVFNPATGMPFTGNIPVSTQAAALLALYPMPNITGNSLYNYQVPVVSDSHIDTMQARMNKNFHRKETLFGGFAFSDSRASVPSIFGWTDTTDTFGLQGNIQWLHRFNNHLIQTVGYFYSRSVTTLTPYWENRENVSGDAGITGNLQSPAYWGPPTLNFTGSGITPLTDGNASNNRNQTSRGTYQMEWFHRTHDVKMGADIRRQEFNYVSEQDPRGIFTFTGAATSDGVNGEGSDFADFLLGIPDTSQIAYGNANKYFRESVYALYVNDDWRVNSQFSINGGIRWEYGAPITELFGRLVNLDVSPTFSEAEPVVANDPTGPVTGLVYPSSLIRPDKKGIGPQVGIAWRPISGSSLVVRAGYGINHDTSVYQNIAMQMAQQAPLSTSLSVQNGPTCPLTLANGFISCPPATADLYSVDPNFHPGYVQTWNLAVQRDLPGSLVMIVTYLGNKGTRLPQEFAPNTYPIGATNPCPDCPIGFGYLTSGGNSHRESGRIELRRRLHNGLTADAIYTFSKSIDDASAFGGQLTTSPTYVQNWLNLGAERGLSNFDQRHLLNATLQYTTGMGIGGKTLMGGWRGAAYKEWTLLIPIIVGSGLPETPIYYYAFPGTAILGAIRADTTGAPIYAAPAGLYLNPAAYTAPVSGQWGTAGRDSITGPMQFSLNPSLARTFRLEGRWNLDVRVDTTNILNHPTFTSYVTQINNALFGTPAGYNPMRSLAFTARVRF
jgi:trimeric autotransporter adhesin